MRAKVNVRWTPNCRHPYTATIKGRGEYGWGNTPAEARAKLAEQIANATSATPSGAPPTSEMHFRFENEIPAAKNRN